MQFLQLPMLVFFLGLGLQYVFFATTGSFICATIFSIESSSVTGKHCVFNFTFVGKGGSV